MCDLNYLDQPYNYIVYNQYGECIGKFIDSGMLLYDGLRDKLKKDYPLWAMCSYNVNNFQLSGEGEVYRPLSELIDNPMIKLIDTIKS